MVDLTRYEFRKKAVVDLLDEWIFVKIFLAKFRMGGMHFKPLI